MKRLLLLLFVGVIFPAKGQQLKVTLKSNTVLDTRNLPPVLKNSMRGLSAIEYRAAGKTNPEKWTIVSDRNAKDDLSGIFESDLRDGDINRVADGPKFISGLKNVESYRWNKKLQTYFFVQEGNRESNVGMITQDGTAQILFPVTGFNRYLTENRGVEGLTFTPNGDLWYSLESGGSTDCKDQAFTVFRKLRYNRKQAQKYPLSSQLEYKYPIDRCACLAKDETFGKNPGNGVSEILAYDDQHLLVLERCYSDKKDSNTVNLFLAKIDEKKRQIDKGVPIFTFKNPGNIEGMTWGPNADGKRTLYLVSDANFRDKQRTQLYVLYLEKGPKTTPAADTVAKRELTSIWLGDSTVWRRLRNAGKADKDCGDLVNVKAIPAKQAYQVVAATTAIAPSPLNHIGFGDDGRITSKLPAVLREGNGLAISILAEPPVAAKTALGKAFSGSQDALKLPDATRDQILPLLGFTAAQFGTAIQKQFNDYYKPFVERAAPYAVSLNDVQVPLVYTQPNFLGHVTIAHSDKSSNEQTVLLTKPRLDKQFLKLVYEQSVTTYAGWEKYKTTFRNLYATYSRQAAEINRLEQKKILLETASDACKCPDYDFDTDMIVDSLCENLEEIKIIQTQLCAIAHKVIVDNRCWINNWMWYTGGQPQLNPFQYTVAAEFNAHVDRRLAVYEEQLKMYHAFAQFCKDKRLDSLEVFLKGPITQLASEIADLKTLRTLAPKREEAYSKWLLDIADTTNILNKVHLNATEKATLRENGIVINWMKHFDALESYSDMNLKPLKFKSSLPERMYDGDRMHAVVHNLKSGQKLSAVETVTITPLRTPLDLSLEPAFSALERTRDLFKEYSWMALYVKKSEILTDSLTTDSIAIDSIIPEVVDLPCDLDAEIKCFRDSQLLIEWLNDQTEPPLPDMAKAYKAFDLADATPAYQSKQTLTGKSQSATGTNIVSYEIFETGNDKPVIKSSYQTYETVRWWPFVSANYVFGSRSTVIFDNTTGGFKTYTGIDNFEVFAGVKWYIHATNVTRTAKGTRLIRNTVGDYYRRVRGNGFGGKLFLFGGLGIRHKFLKNYGVGGGVDIAPGFSINAGANMYFDKKYELVNGIVRKDVDVARFRPFLGVSIDANVVTRFIDLF